ncbi:BamA/TamA family outer membrane protein [Leptolyngbya ohadii]|uniref:BamA/TamA family outer membrane protein n=1 Tax=Leptolyngbya ohadii TaxID=1962290 RepID=UPI000B59F3A4|nr:BamA/TamA family outer membrane protein [Leptolyngbya ohadii]
MRFSPFFLAVLTASATLSLMRPAEAQTPEAASEVPAAKQSDGTAVLTSAISADPDQAGKTSSPSGHSIATLPPGLDGAAVLPSGVSPESTPAEFTPVRLSQLPPDSVSPADEPSSAPETPPPGTQTPEQESPNQLNFPIDSQPGVGVDVQVTPAQPETSAPETPAPDADLAPSTTTPNLPPFPGTEQAPDGTAPSLPPFPGTEGTPGTTPGTAIPGTTPPQADQSEARVLVSEVLVEGTEGDLLNEVYNAIQTQPGQTTTRSQLQQDINAIFATGFFSNVRAVPEDTPLGVRVTFLVQPNPVLQSVQLSGSVLAEQDTTVTFQDQQVPLQQAVDEIFADQVGSIVNLRQLQLGIENLNRLYQDNGYVLAQVIAAPQISPDGTVTLEVAEGVIEQISIQFLEDGQPVDEEGNPVEGKTRDFIITRQFESQPGDVFNQNQIRTDLQRAFGLGIFESLNIALNPGQDPRQVDVTVLVTERNTGSLAAGFGISSASGLFGSVSFQETNLGGNDQDLSAEIQLGQRDLLFDLSFTDPWIGGDPNRTSYTVNAFGRQSISLIFDGGEEEVFLPNGERPRIRRYGGGVSFSRPLGDEWRASLGLQYQNVSVRDVDGTLTPRDEFGNLLSFNDSGIDNLLTLQFSAVQDRRNDPIVTTSGSVLRLSTEQAIPIDGITFNRLRASYSYFIPVRFLRFTQGCQQDTPTPEECPQTLAFNVQGGTIIGDFPPYEAFALGGTDSVRGYGPGDLGSGSSFVQATAEYRFPVFSIVGGALFFDFGSDLGTASDVPGDPAGIRDKPGTGFDYGVGIRVQTPLGLVRVDYAINDQGDNRVTFGIGQGF